MPEPQVSDKGTIPVNTSFTPLTTSGVNGAEIVPPDNPEAESQTSLEDDLFRFKVGFRSFLVYKWKDISSKWILGLWFHFILGTGQSHLGHSSKQV